MPASPTTVNQPTLALEYRPADSDNKFVEARAVGGGGGYYYPPQPIPFCGSNRYNGNSNAESFAITRNTDCNRPKPNMLLWLGPARENERGVLVSVTPDLGTTILHEQLAVKAGVKIQRPGTDISNPCCFALPGQYSSADLPEHHSWMQVWLT